MKDLGVDGKIILKCLPKEYGVIVYLINCSTEVYKIKNHLQIFSVENVVSLVILGHCVI